MLADPRARSKLREFFMQWLKIEQVPDLAKSSQRFPAFGNDAASDLRTSLELFVDDVVWSESSDFRQLFLQETLYLNGRLADLYGVDMPADAPFERVWLSTGERAGLLTHPYLMANFAYAAESSPIHRGVFIARNLLGRTLRPPADAFTPLPADLHPDLTTRERVALQTRAAACMNCHGMINPLGFTLENFDAIGRYRARENGHTVDSSGQYEDTERQAYLLRWHRRPRRLSGPQEQRIAGRVYRAAVSLFAETTDSGLWPHRRGLISNDRSKCMNSISAG